MSLVDGKGHQVPLLQCPPPSSQGYEEIDSETDLESCITTQTFDLKPDSKKPGTHRSICNTVYYRMVLDTKGFKDGMKKYMLYVGK